MSKRGIALDRPQKIGNDAPLLLLDPVNAIDEEDCRPARGNLGKEIDCRLVPQAKGVGKGPPRRPFKAVRFQKEDRPLVHCALDAPFYDNRFPASRQAVDIGEGVHCSRLLGLLNEKVAGDHYTADVRPDVSYGVLHQLPDDANILGVRRSNRERMERP